VNDDKTLDGKNGILRGSGTETTGGPRPGWKHLAMKGQKILDEKRRRFHNSEIRRCHW